MMRDDTVDVPMPVYITDTLFCMPFLVWKVDDDDFVHTCHDVTTDGVSLEK